MKWTFFYVLYVHVTVHRSKFLFNKTNRCTNFPNLFCQENLHISDSFSAHHQELSTVHSALVYVMQVWWQLLSTTIYIYIYITFTWPCTVKNFFLIKPTDALISQIYFVKKIYIFRAVSLPIIRSFPLYNNAENTSVDSSDYTTWKFELPFVFSFLCLCSKFIG
jgi:hypothetical protein